MFYLVLYHKNNTPVNSIENVILLSFIFLVEIGILLYFWDLEIVLTLGNMLERVFVKFILQTKQNSKNILVCELNDWLYNELNMCIHALTEK